MKSEQNANELTIQETPGLLWILGALFLFVGGIFVYGSLGGFTNADEVPQYAIYLSFFMVAIAVAAGLWIIYRAPVTKISVNRLSHTISVTKFGLFGKKENIYSFDDIK